MDRASSSADPDKTAAKNQAARDAVDLADMGHTEALSRKFDTWSMLALAFNVLATWSTEAQDLASGLPNGGPVGVLWGLVAVTLCNVCVALSMGELCSSMPTALGQAYWISRLTGNSTRGRFLSYMCAWINTFGWWALTASQNAFMTSLILAIKAMLDDDDDDDDDKGWDGANKGWVQLLVYVGITVLSTAVNQFGCRSETFLPRFNRVVGAWYVAMFFMMALALLVSVGIGIGIGGPAEKRFQPAGFVFGAWINATGWPDGVVWFTGLVQAAFGLTAFDSVIHMVEEMPAPRRNGPKTMYMSVVCGAVTGFVFMVVCLFCIQDLDRVLASPTGFPFLQLMRDTVGPRAGVVLVALFVGNGVGQGVSVSTSASRLTWSFARDGGIPFGGYFAHVDRAWRVPTRALWLQAGIVGMLGVLYLFASTVLQAVLSVSTVALTISYAMPVAVLLGVGRDRLPPGGEFRLGRLAAGCVNVVAVVYCVVTSVFFMFPSRPDPSADDMNYAVAVFGMMMVVALGFWLVKGRTSYMRESATLSGRDSNSRIESRDGLEAAKASATTSIYLDAIVRKE